MSSRHLAAVTAFAAVTSIVAAARAQVDQITEVVSAANASGGNALGGFVYVERVDGAGNTTKTLFSSTFGSGGSFRRIDGVDGANELTIVANEGDIRAFYTNGDPTRGVITPLVFGMVLNPAAVGSIDAGGAIYLTDGATTRQPGTTTSDPAASKRIYRYDFGTVPAGGDARDIFTPLTSMADLQAASGATSPNISRQAAFSPTGQALYVVDSGSASSGIYKVNPTTGGVTRILNAASTGSGGNTINTEPAVVRAGDADRIYFRGYQQNATATNYNAGGISFIDHDGATTSTPQTYVSAAALADFLQVEVGSTDVRSIAADADGSLYFYDQSTARMVGVDAQGRLYKLASRNERDQALTGAIGSGTTPSATVVRLQTRTITHATAGRVTQVLYAESSPLNAIAGVTVFKPTDFDRDGDEDAADLAGLASAVTSRDVPASIDSARFDLNGNGVVDHKDVKIAQTFQGFLDGDTNFDFVVDFSDLFTLSQHYNATSGKKWTLGDFTGEDAVNAADLALLAANYTGGPLTPEEEQAVGDEVAEEFNRVVPEPAMLTAFAGVALVALRRRRALCPRG